MEWCYVNPFTIGFLYYTAQNHDPYSPLIINITALNQDNLFSVDSVISIETELHRAGLAYTLVNIGIKLLLPTKLSSTCLDAMN